MKYVIFSRDVNGVNRVYPVMFPEYMVHSVVAKAIIEAHDEKNMPGLVVESAGFTNGEMGPVTHGSESLKIKADVERALIDLKILNLPSAFQGIIL